MMEMEGTPMPCCDGNEIRMEITFFFKILYLKYYKERLLGQYMSSFCKNWLCNTYTDGKHWSHFIHAVAISSLTDISDFLWVSRQFQLLVDELGKSLHSVCTATNTHKLRETEKED